MDVDLWPPLAFAYLNTQEHRNKRACECTHTHTQFSRRMGEQVTETFVSSLSVGISGFKSISRWRSGSNT